MFLVTSDNSTLGLTDQKSHVMRLTPDDLRCHLNTEQGPPGLMRVTTSEVRAQTSLHHHNWNPGTCTRGETMAMSKTREYYIAKNIIENVRTMFLQVKFC